MENTYICGTLSNADVDTLETILEVDVKEQTEMLVVFTVATAILSDFNVDFRAKGSGSYVTVAGAGADFTTPKHPVLGADSDLNTATVASHWLKLNVKGVESVRIQAAGTSSVVTGTWAAN
jgi:hypothetical protein